jgi:hypothetical protein
MSDASQLGEDFRFVRQSVARRDATRRGPNAVYWIWAVYVLVGYTLIDFAPTMSGWFFMAGGIAGGALSAWVGSRQAQRLGEVDRRHRRAIGWHFGGGVVLCMIFSFALAAVIPELRNNRAGQVMVVMIGLVYFLAGLHIDPNFLWIGPILMVGGVLVGLVPHYGWTCLGVIIAVSLVVPTLLPARLHAPGAAPSTEADPS